MAELATHDLEIAALVSLPLTLVILLFVFGALLAAGVPVLLGLSSVAAASGLSVLVSYLMPSTGSTSAMILLMGMAVGVDYSLFYVKRYRQELALERAHLDAVQIAAETSGHSVLVSGAAVIISMVSLFAVGDVTFSSLGAGSILVVAIAVLGSLTVLPALLAALGPRMARSSRTSRRPRLWPALLRPALQHPITTLLVSAVLLLALAAPALQMTLRDPDDSSLPDSIPAVASLHRLTESFPDERTTYDVIVSAPSAQAETVAQQLTALSQQLTFTGVGTELTASPDGQMHQLTVATPVDQASSQARTQVEACGRNCRRHSTASTQNGPSVVRRPLRWTTPTT